MDQSPDPRVSQVKNAWGRGFLCLSHGFHTEALVLPSDLEDFEDVQQIRQSVGPVPQFVLLPEAGGDGGEKELIHVYASCRNVAGGSGGKGKTLSGKKLSRLKRISSQQRRRQVTVSCSKAGMPKEERIMTG